jgi:hypothetical protein
MKLKQNLSFSFLHVHRPILHIKLLDTTKRKVNGSRGLEDENIT